MTDSEAWQQLRVGARVQCGGQLLLDAGRLFLRVHAGSQYIDTTSVGS